MSLVLAAPLVPGAALAAILCALAAATTLREPVIVLSLVACVAAGGLALASADRPRRIAWGATSTAALALALRLAVGDLPTFDLRHVGPLDEARALLSAPLLRFLPEPEASLARGILLGDRGSIPAELVSSFSATGTTHLLAISGYNLTLVASAASIGARRLGPTFATAIGLVAVLAYSVLVGLQPSVLRALLMAAVAAFAMSRGRPAMAANGLALAALLMLLFEPRAIGDVGALLSVSATAGLIAWQRSLAARFAFLPAFVGEGLAATLAATAPTLPIIAALFGRISLVAPLANLIAVPLFTPLLAMSALTSAVGAIWLDAALPFAALTYGCAFLLRGAVEAFSAVPGASLAVPDGSVTGAASALALVGAAAAARRWRPDWRLPEWRLPEWRLAQFPRRVPRYVGPAALAAAGVALVLLVFAPPPSDGEIRVLALDVGQGDAYLVESDGRIALIDGGPDPSRLLAELGATLPPWRRRIDFIALTHAHLDHGAGLLALLGRYDIGLAIEPRGLNPGPLRDAWAERLGRAGVMRRAVQSGERIRLGSSTFTVLSPESDPRVDVPSLVLRLERGSFSALFMGDATDPALADLLLSADRLSSTLYIPPHHGAATPFADVLVGAVRPRAAVISVGAQNRYGHPTPETIAALERAGVPIYRTDRDGTVAVSAGGGGLRIKTRANSLAPPRRLVAPYMPSR